MRQIFRWHVDERLSVRQIALRLTESAHVTATGLPRWGTSTVTRMLHNEAYIGTMYYNRHESVSCDPRSTSRRRPTRLHERPTAALPVPPIIDPDLFRRSQTIHHDNSRFSPRHLKSGHYLLRRVVRCRDCDLAMSCHRMRGRNGTFHHYYYCAGHDVLYARRAVGRCPQRNLRSDELDELVWGEVRRHLEHPALIREGYARLQGQAASLQDDGSADDLRALQKQLAELDREEHRLLDAYQAGLVDLDQLRQRQERLRSGGPTSPGASRCSTPSGRPYSSRRKFRPTSRVDTIRRSARHARLRRPATTRPHARAGDGRGRPRRHPFRDPSARARRPTEASTFFTCVPTVVAIVLRCTVSGACARIRPTVTMRPG